MYYLYMNSKIKSFINTKSPSIKVPSVSPKTISNPKVIPIESIHIINTRPGNSGNNNIIMYVIGIIVLAILGINVLLYLGLYTEMFADSLRPIIKDTFGFFGYTLAEGTKITTTNVAKGASAAIDVVSDTTNNTIGFAKEGTVGAINALQNATDYNTLKNKINKKSNKKYESPISDVDTSSIQNNPTSKKGYCLVGEQQGIRSCVRVTNDDICMSGDIFPSRSLCINPNLRV